MKITFIGAGSTVFCKNVLGDCILSPKLPEFEIALLDIDEKRLDGSLENVNTMRYEKISKEFVQGEDLYNLNGVTYKLLEKYSDRNFLLMDKATGNFVVGLGVDFFAKYPRSEGKESEDCVYGIEWGHGVY